MSVSIKSNIKDLSLENYQEVLKQQLVGRCWKLFNASTQLDLKFIIKGCSVKYTPQKYDKITIELKDEFARTMMSSFDDFQSFSAIVVEPFIKDNCINLKLSADMKARTLGSLKPGDWVDVVIQYNNVWKIGDKHFASFELLQFKKVEPQVVDLFTD